MFTLSCIIALLQVFYTILYHGTALLYSNADVEAVIEDQARAARHKLKAAQTKLP